MPICTFPQCTNHAAWSYNNEGEQFVCDQHFAQVQQHLTALGKIGPLHPHPVVFHRLWTRVEDPTAEGRIRDLERKLSEYLGLPALVEDLKLRLRQAEGAIGVYQSQLEQERVNVTQAQHEISQLRAHVATFSAQPQQ